MEIICSKMGTPWGILIIITMGDVKGIKENIWATIPLVGGTVESHKSPNVIPKTIEFKSDGGEKMNTQILTALRA